jgi:hypothetical protein
LAPGVPPASPTVTPTRARKNWNEVRASPQTEVITDHSTRHTATILRRL